MQIAILGGGSFGTAMGVLLARNKADLDVCLLLRNPEICESINEDNMNRFAFRVSFGSSNATKVTI